MIDTHAHCQFNAYKNDMEEVIERCKSKKTIVNLIGTQKDTSRKAVEVAEDHDGFFASVGLHPEHLFSSYVDENETQFLSKEDEFDFEYYRKLTERDKVIGIGECGIDLYRIPEGMEKEDILKKQKEVFLAHVRLARETNLPLVIHCRDAHPEMIETLSSPETKGVKGTMHCYTSNWKNAEQYLKLGFYIGFTGIITFPPQKSNPAAQEELLEVVKRIPLEKILLETDCPYLSPIPYRGKRGEPWMVEAIAMKIAELRKLEVNDVLKITTENALQLFNKIKT